MSHFVQRIHSLWCSGTVLTFRLTLQGPVEGNKHIKPSDNLLMKYHSRLKCLRAKIQKYRMGISSLHHFYNEEWQRLKSSPDALWMLPWVVFAVSWLELWWQATAQECGDVGVRWGRGRRRCWVDACLKTLEKVKGSSITSQTIYQETFLAEGQYRMKG